ncbi:hypothetical protein NC653_002268 [Populus alba x Populus x berolinensis]|uniref:Uncharacterized protein n=1 Tax=Populus alba x Populus x berolinensis TaxID=444605 RepID=A0AAD6RN85_9ROSI|nr:hypothetical protein NC653_002268 [Populus alba x Populus x berolinensis]
MGVAHLRGFRLNLVTVPVITMERCCLNAVVVLLQTPNLAPVFLEDGDFDLAAEEEKTLIWLLRFSSCWKSYCFKDDIRRL